MHALMVRIVITLLLSLPTLGEPPPMRRLAPWIYFDLGNTLVDTRQGFEKVTPVPGALAHLRELKAKGYHLGLISNIPEIWGKTYDEKLSKLKNMIKKGWHESQDFPWEVFDVILLSETEKQRKPAPHLFEKALAMSYPCPALYVADHEGMANPEDEQLRVARRLGFATYEVRLAPSGPSPKDPASLFFMDEQKIGPWLNSTFRSYATASCPLPL